MKNIKSIEEFLFESKSSAKKRFLDRGLISDEVFNTFLEVDITPTKKFIEKMCEFFVSGSSEEEVVTTFQKAISLSNRQILSFDISLIKSIEELQTLISEKEDYQTRSERNFIAQQGAELLYEKDNILFIRITTEEASKKYGKGTEWCISAEKDNQFINYHKSNDIVFVIDKNLPDGDYAHKIAVLYNDSKPDLHIYDSNDDSSSISLDYLVSIGFDFKNIFNYTNENVNMLFYRNPYGANTYKQIQNLFDKYCGDYTILKEYRPISTGSRISSIDVAIKDFEFTQESFELLNEIHPEFFRIVNISGTLYIHDIDYQSNNTNWRLDAFLDTEETWKYEYKQIFSDYINIEFYDFNYNIKRPVLSEILNNLDGIPHSIIINECSYETMVEIIEYDGYDYSIVDNTEKVTIKKSTDFKQRLESFSERDNIYDLTETDLSVLSKIIQLHHLGKLEIDFDITQYEIINKMKSNMQYLLDNNITEISPFIYGKRTIDISNHNYKKYLYYDENKNMLVFKEDLKEYIESVTGSEGINYLTINLSEVIDLSSLPEMKDGSFRLEYSFNNDLTGCPKYSRFIITSQHITSLNGINYTTTPKSIFISGTSIIKWEGLDGFFKKYPEYINQLTQKFINNPNERPNRFVFEKEGVDWEGKVITELDILKHYNKEWNN